MSYERDKDRYTRGVGAIAALDAGSRARYGQRLARAKQTAAIDRRLSRYTYRPGGGMAVGLGAINLTGIVPSTIRSPGDLLRADVDPHISPPLPSGGSGGGAGGGSTPPSGYGPNTGGTQPTRLYGGAGTVLQQPPRTPTAPTGYAVGYLPGRGTPTRVGPTPVTGVIVDPVRGTVTPVSGGVKTTPGAITVGGGGSGGGGGGGGGFTISTPSYPDMETPAVPDVPDDVGLPGSPDAPTGMSTAKKALLIGGGALALWYLFGRKKGRGSP